MGVTYIEGQVKGPSGKQGNVKFLIDSGATYSLLPKTAQETIGLKPKRKLSFTLTGQQLKDMYQKSLLPSRKGKLTHQ